MRVASRGVVAPVGLIEGGGEVAGARGRLGAIDCHRALDVVQRRRQSRSGPDALIAVGAPRHLGGVEVGLAGGDDGAAARDPNAEGVDDGGAASQVDALLAVGVDRTLRVGVSRPHHDCPTAKGLDRQHLRLQVLEELEG